MFQSLNSDNLRGVVRKKLFALLPFALHLTSTPVLPAQTAAFASAQSTVGAGLKSPNSVALDPAGNPIIADKDNNRVLKVLSDGSQAIVTTAVNAPTAVAVDSAGNIYVGSAGQTLSKVTPDGHCHV